MVLALSLTGTSLWADDAQVDATDGTNTLGKLLCAQADSVPLVECAFEALPKGEGKVTLRVQLPDRTLRTLFFEGGHATGSDSPNAVTSALRNDTVFVFVNPSERFEVPGALVAAQ